MRFKLNNKRRFHKWFAWHPIIVSQDTNNNVIGKHLVWLETVERIYHTNAYRENVWFYQVIEPKEQE